MTFLRLNACAAGDDRLWQVAVLFHMREAFRSGDVWLVHSRRYGDLKQALVPIAAARATAQLAVPFGSTCSAMRCSRPALARGT